MTRKSCDDSPVSYETVPGLDDLRPSPSKTDTTPALTDEALERMSLKPGWSLNSEIQMMARELLAYRRAAPAADDPRAVDRFNPACRYTEEGFPEAYAFKHPTGEYVRFNEYSALREKLEAAVTMLSEKDFEYNRKTNALIARHAEQLTAARAEMEEHTRRAVNEALERAADAVPSCNACGCQETIRDLKQGDPA